jgi:hypothetical protein
VLEFQSFIRGYHEYQTVWTSNLGDVLGVEHEPTNCKDRYVVADLSRTRVPDTYYISFLREGVAEVMGNPVNHGSGYDFTALRSI